jgi:hypothetical protein
MPWLPATVQLAQGAPKLFDFLFISELLTLGQFQGFEHFLHSVQRFAEGLNDTIYILNGLLNGFR